MSNASLLIKRESVFGTDAPHRLGPGPRVLGESGFSLQPREEAPTIYVPSDGQMVLSAELAARIQPGKALSISVVVPGLSAELRAVYAYTRRRLKNGMVKVFFRPVQIPTVSVSREGVHFS